MRISTQIYLIHEGKWLLMLRNRKKNDINEGRWIAVGGKKEEDETAYECAVRETFEETGLAVQSLEYRGTVDFIYDDMDPERIIIYSSSIFSGILHESDEGTLRWIDESDILSLNLWEGDRIFLRKMLDHEKKPFWLTLHYDSAGNLTGATAAEAENNG